MLQALVRYSVVLTFVLSAISSAAAEVVSYVDTWTGVVTNPRGVEVDTSGNVYVADYGAKLIRKFSSTGTAGLTMSTTNGPIDLAISPADGSIFAVDVSWPGLVEKLTSNGSSLTSWAKASPSLAVATDSSGNVYVGTDNNVITKYGSTGTKLDDWTGLDTTTTTAYLCGLALDPTETIAYWINCDPTSSSYCYLMATDLSTDTTTVLSALLDSKGSRGQVAVDTSTGNIYVAERSAKVVEVFDNTGSRIDYWNTWDTETGEVSYADTGTFGSIFGIAVDSKTDRVYVVDQASKVFVFNVVPEPSTSIMLVAGLIGLVVLERRRAKQIVTSD